MKRIDRRKFVEIAAGFAALLCPSPGRLLGFLTAPIETVTWPIAIKEDMILGECRWYYIRSHGEYTRLNEYRSKEGIE